MADGPKTRQTSRHDWDDEDWGPWHSATRVSGERSHLFFGLPDQVDKVVAYVDEACDGYPCHDAARQIAHELATNAIQHTRSGEPDGWFVVRIVIFRTWSRLTVYDLGHPTNRPIPLDVPSDADRGHGLHLVAALAETWGTGGDRTGRTVWADMPGYQLPDPAANTADAANRPPAAPMPPGMIMAVRGHVAARLRTRRNHLGLSQQDLATRTGLKHWSYIDRIEHAQTNPTLSTLFTLATALEIELSDLLMDLTS